VPLAVAAVLAAGGRARAQSDEDLGASTARYTLRAELGTELDTNAHRTEQVNVPGVVNPAPVVSPVGRGVLTGSLSDVVGAGHQVSMSATLASKVFASSEARAENVGIAESTLLWRAPLGRRHALLLAGAYYEAFQPDAAIDSPDRRDFRSLTPTLRLSRNLGDAEVGLGGGYRVFVFKPDHSFDFQAPTAALDLRWTHETADGAADWDAGFRAVYERRAFPSLAYVEAVGACPTYPECPPTTGSALRVDNFMIGGLDVSRTGTVLIGAGYALHLNLSNSFGETVTRHFVTARFAAALPADFYLAGRVEVLVARYADGVFIAMTDVAQSGRPFVSIEDENRNNARVELSRNLGERLQLLARYTFYANELGSAAVSYRRHTALLSLAFTLEK
jgi:hypothetical protein